MKPFLTRMLAAITLAACVMLVSSASGVNAPVLQPNKLIILSTTDVKGKTGPCGCHIPKGGLSRRASMIDSVRTSYGQVLVVDNGGFFPEDDVHRDAAWFLMDAMKTLRVDAVNVGDRDLRFGRAYLEQRARKISLPIVSANLLDKRTRKPVFSPYLVKRIGNTTVGVFGLISDKSDLGPGKDSLMIDDPQAVARATVIELQRKGAEVIVLLSQLGKVEGEDLVSAVDGIDAVMLGRNVMLIQRGRMVKNTIGCYGGEQGHYVCRTELTLDEKHHMVTGEAEAVILGPEVSDKPEIATMVKTFEDALNWKIEKAQKEKDVQSKMETSDNSPSHFVGAELCIRCHPKEGDAWKTTSHANAWASLVTVKRETVEECASCHVSGYQKPGGFASFASTPAMANVQCESCHGMGTEHEAFVAMPHKLDATACMACHDKTRDPHFNFEAELPKIVHSNLSGETVQNKKVKKPGDEKLIPDMMKVRGS